MKPRMKQSKWITQLQFRNALIVMYSAIQEAKRSFSNTIVVIIPSIAYTMPDAPIVGIVNIGGVSIEIIKHISNCHCFRLKRVVPNHIT